MVSFVEAKNRLLSGKALSWGSFEGHRSGTIVLSDARQRRVFGFLLAQDSGKVAQGSEDLFSGLIAAWKAEGDPASEDTESVPSVGEDVWRLDRIDASGFGGLTLFGGPEFKLWVNGENWCLEGQNGSGKTSLASAILWALTGKRIREQDGPVEELGARSPVLNGEGKKIGDWPSFASYPADPADLTKSVSVWVRLTFKNADGELAEAYRIIVCPLTGDAKTTAGVDLRLRVATELMETGLLMPARIAKVGFGDRSQSLYEAVKMLTGLDQFADISDGCSQYFTHAGRRFLRYGKDNGIEGYSTKFSESMVSARLRAKELSFKLPDDSALGDNNVVKGLRDAADSASSEAGEHLATLKSG
jgi:hypothetical protein